jgi:hypothetical protein
MVHKTFAVVFLDGFLGFLGTGPELQRLPPWEPKLLPAPGGRRSGRRSRRRDTELPEDLPRKGDVRAQGGAI